MARYLFRRLLTWLGLIFLSTNLTYFLASWFLDPRSNYQQRRPPIPEAQIDAALEQRVENEQIEGHVGVVARVLVGVE